MIKLKLRKAHKSELKIEGGKRYLLSMDDINMQTNRLYHVYFTIYLSINHFWVSNTILASN